MKDKTIQENIGYVVVHLGSESVNEPFATEDEAEQARMDQINEYLSEDIYGYTMQLQSDADEHGYELTLTPDEIKNIVLRQSLEILQVFPIEDEEDDE